jgi:hypothetical protein
MIGFASTCAVLTYHSAHLLRLRHWDRTQTIGVVAKHASTRFLRSRHPGHRRRGREHGALVLTATTRTADRVQATLLALSSRWEPDEVAVGALYEKIRAFGDIRGTCGVKVDDSSD